MLVSVLLTLRYEIQNNALGSNSNFGQNANGTFCDEQRIQVFRRGAHDGMNNTFGEEKKAKAR